MNIETKHPEDLLPSAAERQAAWQTRRDLLTARLNHANRVSASTGTDVDALDEDFFIELEIATRKAASKIEVMLEWFSGEYEIVDLEIGVAPGILTSSFDPGSLPAWSAPMRERARRGNWGVVADHETAVQLGDQLDQHTVERELGCHLLGRLCPKTERSLVGPQVAQVAPGGTAFWIDFRGSRWSWLDADATYAWMFPGDIPVGELHGRRAVAECLVLVNESDRKLIDLYLGTPGGYGGLRLCEFLAASSSPGGGEPDLEIPAPKSQRAAVVGEDVEASVISSAPLSHVLNASNASASRCVCFVGQAEPSIQFSVNPSPGQRDLPEADHQPRQGGQS